MLIPILRICKCKNSEGCERSPIYFLEAGICGFPDMFWWGLRMLWITRDEYCFGKQEKEGL